MSRPRKKKYAFLLMGSHYDPAAHSARFETSRDEVILQTVRDFEEAKVVVRALSEEGVGAIELCGAFGSDSAGELARLTDNEIAIGYVVHDPVLDDVFARFFG